MKKLTMSLVLLLVATVLSGCCPCWWGYDGGYGHHGGRHYDDRGGYGERRY